MIWWDYRFELGWRAPMKVLSRILGIAALTIFSGQSVFAQDFQKGMQAYTIGNFNKAFNEFISLAEKGDTRAQKQLGKMYSNGEGVPKDIGSAIRWYLLGQADGQVNFDLIFMLSQGEASGTDLSGTDFSGHNLSGIDLSKTNLNAANLSGADLSKTNLNGANLSGADLSEANLNGANLGAANLLGANLQYTNMNGAILCNTTLPNGSVAFSGCQ